MSGPTAQQHVSGGAGATGSVGDSGNAGHARFAGGSADAAGLLRQSSATIRTAIGQAPQVPADWRPGPDRWSLAEVVTHLLDSLIANALRFRHVLTETEPELVPYDHERWVLEQQGVEQPLDVLLDTHTALTRYNALLLEQLTPSQWERCGREGERRYSLRHIVEIFVVRHLDGHMQQIRAIQEAYLAADHKEEC